MNNIIEWFEENTKTTHRALHGQSIACAAELCRLGVKRGDKVGVFFDKSSSYLVMLLAVWRLNAVVVPLSPKSLRQSRFATQYSTAYRDTPIKLLIHSAYTHEEVLLEWMRQSDAIAYALEYFASPVIPTAKPVIVTHFKFIQAEDVAVQKIPEHENIEPADLMLTHGELMQNLEQSNAQLQPAGTVTLSTIVSNLLSLVTLPIPKKAISSVEVST